MGDSYRRRVEERDAYRMTAEEGGELIAEMARAIAGLAGEQLVPCCKECEGHFGKKADALFKKGLAAYGDHLPPGERVGTKGIPF